MTVNLEADIEAGLQAIAQARGLSVEAYLRDLVRSELPHHHAGEPELESGMVTENGLRLYRTGNPLPLSVINDAVKRTREERVSRILGNRP